MQRHADLLTPIKNWAGRTARELSGTPMLTEGYENAIDLDPEAAGKLLFKGHRRLFRRLGMDVSPPIGHALDVGIDRDTRLTAGDTQDKVGALRADFERCSN